MREISLTLLVGADVDLETVFKDLMMVVKKHGLEIVNMQLARR